MAKFFSSFTFLNLTQFLVALNDNLYKLLLVFFLIDLQGESHSNTILAIAGAVYVVPFLLFASFAGTLADRFSKRSIIYFTRITEILTTGLGVLFFWMESIVGGYAVLFLMAFQSTLFSPCKYGIIPEIVPPTKISHYNGIINATTYLAIILGTFFGAFFTQISHKHFVVAVLSCVIVAILAFLTGLGIEKTLPRASAKKVSYRFVYDIIPTLRRAAKRRYLVSTLIFGAYFFFIGGYVQINIIPFTLQSLHLSDVQGGYLFLMTAIGIGLGSYLAGQASGKDIELGFVPFAALGITVCFIGIFLFDTHFFIVVPLLIILGFFGGFYTVPINTFIQVASPEEDRGENVAAGNFLSFVGVILASGMLALLGNALNLSAAAGFLIVGILTCLVGITLLLLYADQVLRLCVGIWARMFLKIRVIGRGRIPSKHPVLLVAPRSSWLDTIIVMTTLPRTIRYIVPIRHGHKQSLFYRFLKFIPLDVEHFSPIGAKTIRSIRHELETGNSVCLMHPIDFPSKTLKEWESALESLLKDIPVPILPVHISQLPSASKKGRFAQLKSLREGVIKVSYGKTLTEEI